MRSGIAITDLRSPAKGIERSPGTQIQHLRMNIPEKGMPGLSEKDSRIFPRQVDIGMTDTKDGKRGARSPEIGLKLGGGLYLTDGRPRQVDSQTRIEQVKTPVRPRVQVFSIRIIFMVHRVQMKQSVHDFSVCPRIIKQISAYLPVNL